MRRFTSRLLSHLVSDQGSSLAEVLVSLAILGMVFSVVGSVLTTMTLDLRLLQKQTDAYEALRLPAAVFVQDARTARTVAYDPEFLKLYTGLGFTNYIMYSFRYPDESPDPNNLHRRLVQGGSVTRDDIVGWNLVPPDGTTDTTWFGCTCGGSNRLAQIHLVKQPGTGSATFIHLDAQALSRS